MLSPRSKLNKSTFLNRKVLYAVVTASILMFLALPLVPQFLSSRSFAEGESSVTPSLSISPSTGVSLIVSPGSFASGSQTIAVETDNYTGYTLSLQTTGSSTALAHTSLSNQAIPTIVTESEEGITSSEFTTASYGYSIDTAEEKYYKPVPAAESDGVILATTSHDNPGTGSHTLTFGVKTESDTPAGTYRNTFALTATANDTGYVVTYDANVPQEELENITGMPDPNPSIGTISGLEAYLSCSEPMREGYAFMGWSESADATEADYAPCGAFPLDPETPNVTTLYAVWKETIILNFHSDPSEFEDGEDINTISFEKVCEADTGYVVESEAAVSKTPNYEDDGSVEDDYDYENGYVQSETITIEGADRLLVEVEYSLHDYYYLMIRTPNVMLLPLRSEDETLSRTIIIDGDTVTLDLNCTSSGSIFQDRSSGYATCSSGGGGSVVKSANSGHYYGYYAKVTPIYNTPQENGEETVFGTNCSWNWINGDYEEPAAPEGKYFIGWAPSTNQYGEIISKDRILSIIINNIGAGYMPAGVYDLYAVYRDPMSVTFDANGATFNDDPELTSYTITCGEECDNGYVYKSNDYQVSKTPNLESDGTMTEPYEKGLVYADSVTIETDEEDPAILVEVTKGLYTDSHIVILDDDGQPAYIEGSDIGWTFSETLTSVSVPVEGDTAIICLFNAPSGNGGTIPKEAGSSAGTKNRGLPDGASASDMCNAFIEELFDDNSGGGDILIPVVGPIKEAKSRSASTVSSGYGYYAKVSEIFPEERENSTQVSIEGECYLVILNGAEYLTPDAPEGYEFIGWSTDPDDTSAEYDFSWNNPWDSLPRELYDDFLYGTTNLTLYAIYQKIPITIIYDSNGGDGEMPENRYKFSDVEDGEDINLIYASNFSRDGYGFAGFSFDSDAGAKLVDDTILEKPVVYGPNENITLPTNMISLADDDGKVRLYAVWIPAETDGNDNPVYLQGWTGCAGMSDGEVTALTDSRDNEVYAVAKFEKNSGESNEYSQCWIIENLRLDVATADITDVNTDHPTEAFREEASNLSSASWTSCTNLASSCTYLIAYGMSNVNGTYSNYYTSNYESLGTRWYSYGGMYNWYTATAGNGTSDKNDRKVDGSLCPSGWNLPSDGDDAYDFNRLDVALGGTGANQNSAQASNRWRAYPMNLVYSGDYHGSSAYNRGSIGLYWSSVSGHSYYAYRLKISNAYLEPNAVESKPEGIAIRCIAGAMESFTLEYDANGGDPASVPQSQTSATQGNGIYSFTVSSTTPTRSGFTFAGWMDEHGFEAQPGAQYVAYNSNSKLYALWTNNDCNPSATTIATGSNTDAICLQDMNATVQSTMVSKATYTLKDARDNQEYTISKLDDGNIWMTQNLDYGSNEATLLTSDYTDIASGTVFMAPENTLSFFSYDHTNSQKAPRILNSGSNGYYSFAAAIASTTSYSSRANLTTSICPSGWDLPTSEQYDNLKSVANLNRYSDAYASPYRFRYAGYVNGGSYIADRNLTVFLWTSTNYTDSYAYGTNSYSSPTNNTYKISGGSVRCIASNGSATIHYDANGGIGNVDDQTGEINALMALSHNAFSPADEHKRFREWNTRADGSGVAVPYRGTLSTALAIEGVTDGGSLTLYAQWDDLHYITFVDTSTEDLTDTVSVVDGKGIVAQYPFGDENYDDYHKVVGWDIAPNDASDSSGTIVYRKDQNIVPTEDLTLYTVWRRPVSVVYNANGGRCETSGDVTTTCMQNIRHTNVVENDSFDLFASNYNRSGYGFAGWSIDPNAQPGGSSRIYGPNETIEITSDIVASADNNGLVTLYSVWVAQNGDLQSFNCSSLAPGAVTALTDTRDNEAYAVAKLADGNCWMIENLRLESENSSDASKAQGFGSGFIGLATAETAHFADDTTSNSLYSTSIITGDNQGYRFPRYNNTNTSSRNASPEITDYIEYSNSHLDLDTEIYSYGNYYTWSAAIADTSDYGQDSYEVTIAETSICPTGWHLPYGYDETWSNNSENLPGGFFYLDTMLESPDGSHGNGEVQNTRAASQRWRIYPNNFVYSGSIHNNSSISVLGKSGTYWSATSSGHNFVRAFDLDDDSISPSKTITPKNSGHSIRCVASPRQTLTLSFDTTKVASVEIDGVSYNTNGATISLAENSTHTINMTFRSGYEFDNWSISGATVVDTTTQSTTLAMGTTSAILTANAKASCISNITGNMQDALAPSAYCEGATGTMTDNRTTTGTGAISTPLTYTVAKLDDKLWMTQNLAITGTIPASGSNFTGNDFNVSQYDLTDPTHCTSSGADVSNPLGYSNVCSHYSAGDVNTDNKPTAWYNFAAATAGSITGYENSNDPTGDICPSGWRLPTGTEQSSLMSAISSDNTVFNPIYGGIYFNNSFSGASSLGYWWSSTASSEFYRNFLRYASSNIGSGNGYRYSGYYVRCIRN